MQTCDIPNDLLRRGLTHTCSASFANVAATMSGNTMVASAYTCSMSETYFFFEIHLVCAP